jgi:CRISPR system Cascade subunit CasA
MNLIEDPWMPVRRKDGSRRHIRPDQLADEEIVAFDAPRPDFNGALAQFAIGLLQTTTPVDSPGAWRELMKSPPSSKTLQEWFSSVVPAFEFDGSGPRFMQDLTLQPEGSESREIAALLIDAPGENALKENRDHFIKRGQIAMMCMSCAAASLMTLQINAPAGGAGHRTGLRGGGPLSTLLVSQLRRTLWNDLWLNVRERAVFLAQCGDATRSNPRFIFPWLTDIRELQADGAETAPPQVHPSHVFWAMPRRIRLDSKTATAGQCSLCGLNSNHCLEQYATRPNGMNYKGNWDHPLSPYYESKEGWLPKHPQPGGIGYRHWLAWVAGASTVRSNQRPARVVEHALAHRMRALEGGLAIWAFGYDMDNMKARCWYESRLPLYGLGDCNEDGQRLVASEVGLWLAAADLACVHLRDAVKNAWFDVDSRGNFGHIEAAFWASTEPLFYVQLKSLIEAVRADLDFDQIVVRRSWHHELSKAATVLFDEVFVGSGEIAQQDPHRIAKAFRQLRKNLFGSKLRRELGLPDDVQIRSTESQPG